MVAARWSSLVVAALLLAPSSAALASDRSPDGATVQLAQWRGGDRRDDRIYGGARDRRRDVAFDNGYADGYEKGINDARDRHSFDPTRHKWYRAGNRHYDSRYGPRAQYENIYRDGFRSGYDAGYRDGNRYDRRRSRRY
jgi:hypothetical protein